MLGKVCQLARRAVATAAVVCALATSAHGADVVPDVPFSSPGAAGDVLLLDLYVPSNGVSPNGFTVVIVHGGSYSTGARSDVGDLCAALADLGFAVVDPDYTLVSPSNVASYPQPISDVFNAVNWIRTTGETLGLPNRVIVCGISAGSTIAMTAAMAAQTTTFARLPAPAHGGYTIDGAIAIMGRYDLVWNVGVGVPLTLVNYIGVPFSRPDWPQVWGQASAISYVNANSPPTVLYHGAIDALVQLGNSTRLAEALQVAGAPNQLNVIPSVGHDIAVLGNTVQQQAQTLASASVWIDTHPGNNAPPSTGACCAMNGLCTVTTFLGCNTPWVPNFACSPNPCPQPPPMGACCSATGVCTQAPSMYCSGAWTIDTPCSPNPCAEPSGSCCTADGSCASTIQSACADAWTMAGACDPNPCSQPPPPTGACCMGTTCAVALAANCTGPNRRFTAVNAACNASGNHQTPCCHADFNQNNAVAVTDIFDFLAAWFLGSSDACITSPNSGPPAVLDIFDFLGAWFGGC